MTILSFLKKFLGSKKVESQPKEKEAPTLKKESAFKKTVVFDSVVKYNPGDAHALLLLKVDGRPELIWTSVVENFTDQRIETQNTIYMRPKKLTSSSPVAGLDTAELSVEDFELAQMAHLQFNKSAQNSPGEFTYEGYVDLTCHPESLPANSVPAELTDSKVTKKTMVFDVNATIEDLS